ncbi:MAG: glycosyltransferase family 9 protein [Ignavibacteriales bacterium]|nr:glycosyltransferase family 9 protein [Ignavibacteriales bacterium]
MHAHNIRRESFGKVFIASSLDDAQRIERSVHGFSLKNISLRLSIWIRVVLFNLLLKFLHLLWFSQRAPKEEEVRTIVVYVQGMLGDTAVHLPSICSLKKKFPAASLTVVSYNEQFPLESLLRPLPYIDRLLFINAQPVRRDRFSFHYSSDDLTTLSCDLFVNFSPYCNRGVPGFLLREMIFARKTVAKFAMGFRLNSIGSRGTLNCVQHYFVKNEPRRGSEITASLHLPKVLSDEYLPVQHDAVTSAKKKIGFESIKGRKIVIVNPGSKYLVRCWNPERFGRIALWLKETYDAIVLVNTLKSESDIAGRVVRASNGAAIDLCGTLSQGELIEVLRLSSLCVTNNTGTMHLAALVDIPIVALFNTRFSVTHWFPKCSTIRALHAFDEQTYSYDDSGSDDSQLRAISEDDVKRSIDDILK